MLDSVLTAREFLIQMGGEPATELAAFLVRGALPTHLVCQARLQLHRGEALRGHSGPLRGLTLTHVDSVVDFLLFVRAKRMIRNRQNVFEQVGLASPMLLILLSR